MCPHRLTCWMLGPQLLEQFWKVLGAWRWQTSWGKWVTGDISLGTVFCYDHSVSLLPVFHEVNSFCYMILLLHCGCRKHIPSHNWLSLPKPGARINPSSLRLLVLVKMTRMLTHAFTQHPILRGQHWNPCWPAFLLVARNAAVSHSRTA